MAATGGSTAPPLEDADDALLRCLASLLQAIEAADVLGIPTQTARDVHADQCEHVGIRGEPEAPDPVGVHVTSCHGRDAEDVGRLDRLQQ